MRFLLHGVRLLCGILAGVLLFFPVILPSLLLLLANKITCKLRGQHRIVFQNPLTLDGTRTCEDCTKALTDEEYEVALATLKEQLHGVMESLKDKDLLTALSTALSQSTEATKLN